MSKSWWFQSKPQHQRWGHYHEASCITVCRIHPGGRSCYTSTWTTGHDLLRVVKFDTPAVSIPTVVWKGATMYKVLTADALFVPVDINVTHNPVRRLRANLISNEYSDIHHRKWLRNPRWFMSRSQYQHKNNYGANIRTYSLAFLEHRPHAKHETRRQP